MGIPNLTLIRERVAKAKGVSKANLDADCTLCNNAQWWIDNGFTEAERNAFCGPNGLNCPGFDNNELSLPAAIPAAPAPVKGKK